MRIAAIVVTYNRKALLVECLQAIAAQTQQPDAVLVVDNASTDGTRELLARDFPDAEVLALATNDGASGGFHDGMQHAMAEGYDWLWVMDDDTIPAPDALERLVDRIEPPDGLPRPVMLVSKILWTDGTMHPMNTPGPMLQSMDRFVTGVESGLIQIRAATFPSMLVEAAAIRRTGLPRRDFFIWSDDIEFTMRLLKHEVGYLVPDSVAIHKTATAHRPAEGGPRFYYAVRNGLATIRSEGLTGREKLGHTFLVGDQTREYLVRERFAPKALSVVGRGLKDGLRMPRRR